MGESEDPTEEEVRVRGWVVHGDGERGGMELGGRRRRGVVSADAGGSGCEGDKRVSEIAFGD